MATDIIARGLAGGALGKVKALAEQMAAEYGASVSLGIDDNYVLTLKLLNKAGETLGDPQTVDLPLESVVVDGHYDSENQALVLELDNGNEISIPVSALIEGLQNEITPENPLSADLIDDTNTAHKFATTAQLTQIATNEGDIADLQDNFEDTYDATVTYVQGAIVVHDHMFYQANQAIDPAEAWDPTHWTKVQIGDVFADKNYFGFKRISAPPSTTLTDEEYECFKYGVVVDGEFLGLLNPVFLPPKLTSAFWQGGIVIGTTTIDTKITIYRLTGKAISLTTDAALISLSPFNRNLSLSGERLLLQGKDFPMYPSSPAIPQQLQYNTDNTLSWGNVSGFKRIPVPASATLTDEQIEDFKHGVVIDGEFLGLKRPTFFPSISNDSALFGFVAGYLTLNWCQVLREYKIQNNLITVGSYGIRFTNSSLVLDTLTEVNHKAFPAYPSDTTKPYALEQNVGGNLAWNEKVNNLAPEYDATATYAVGVVVMHDGRLYQCTTAIETAEVWDATHWTQVKVDDVYAVSGDLAGKQDTLVSGINIKTVNNQSLLGSGNIDATITVDDALSDSSTNPVQNKVVKAALDGKIDESDTTDVVISDSQVANAPLLGSITVDGDPYNSPKKVSDLQNDLGFISEATASDINSGAATSGQVLTANGSGGASWQAPQSGGGHTLVVSINNSALGTGIEVYFTNGTKSTYTSSVTLNNVVGFAFDYDMIDLDAGIVAGTGSGSFKIIVASEGTIEPQFPYIMLTDCEVRALGNGGEN